MLGGNEKYSVVRVLRPQEVQNTKRTRTSQELAGKGQAAS
jgi:hypothetical protein